MNATELRRFLQRSKNQSLLDNHNIPIPLVLPKPQWGRTLEIYNDEAWHELHRRLSRFDLHAKVQNFTCMINGGSASAAAKLTARRNLFYYALDEYLHGNAIINQSGAVKLNKRLMPPQARFQVIDRAHGSRNTLHSALFMDFFMPDQLPDLIIWEFAINDVDHFEQNEANERSPLIFWLDQIVLAVEDRQRNGQKPPLVILVYSWRSPMDVDEDGRVINPVFESHHRIAAKYPFVAGHVNVASYFDELRT